MTEQEAIQQFRTDFDRIGKTIVLLMAREFEQQGHRATGKLLESLENETTKLLDGIDTAISYLNYGNIVNNGVSANRIPFGGGRGGTSKFITALMEWVRFKNLTSGLDKDIKGMAFAIAKNMKKQGMPTSGSYRFSQNGRRMKWVDYTIERNDVYMTNEVQDVSQQYIQNLYWSKIDQITTGKYRENFA